MTSPFYSLALLPFISSRCVLVLLIFTNKAPPLFFSTISEALSLRLFYLYHLPPPMISTFFLVWLLCSPPKITIFGRVFWRCARDSLCSSFLLSQEFLLSCILRVFSVCILVWSFQLLILTLWSPRLPPFSLFPFLFPSLVFFAWENFSGFP